MIESWSSGFQELPAEVWGMPQTGYPTGSPESAAWKLGTPKLSLLSPRDVVAGHLSA